MATVIVDQEKCVGKDECGECAEICPEELFTFNDDGKAFVEEPDECMDCESCLEDCKGDAITIEGD